VRDLLVRGNALATSSVVVRTSLLKSVGGMNENADMIGAEDYNAWLRIAKLTERFKYLPRTLGYYQLHDQGVSQKDMSEPAAHAVADYVDLLIPGERNKVFANLRYAKGRFRYIKGDRQAARQDLLFSCRYGRPIVRLKSLFMLVCLVVEMAVTVCRKAPFA
jgi:hypothetical protein